jgi:hypothetical protein
MTPPFQNIFHFRVEHKIKCELEQVLNVSEMSIFPANSINKVSGDVTCLCTEKLVEEEVLGGIAERRRPEQQVLPYEGKLASNKDRIMRLKHADRIWVESAETSEQMVSDFFKVLYTKDPDVNPNQLLALYEHKVTQTTV